MRWLPALLVTCSLAGCSAQRATMTRNLGIGLVAEGVLVTGGAFVTRDSDEGITDAVITASPLLAVGVAAWVVGTIVLGIEPTPNR